MLKMLPGILGALLVVVGVAVMFWPLGLIVAGGFLLVLDSRLQVEAVREPAESAEDR